MSKYLFFMIGFMALQNWAMPAQAAHSRERVLKNALDKPMKLLFQKPMEFHRDDMDEMDTLTLQEGAVVADEDIDAAKPWCKVTLEHWPEISQDKLQIAAGTQIEFNKPVAEEKEDTIATNYVSTDGHLIERVRCFTSRREVFLGTQNNLPTFQPVVAKNALESVFAGKTQIAFE